MDRANKVAVGGVCFAVALFAYQMAVPMSGISTSLRGAIVMWTLFASGLTAATWLVHVGRNRLGTPLRIAISVVIIVGTFLYTKDPLREIYRKEHESRQVSVAAVAIPAAATKPPPAPAPPATPSVGPAIEQSPAPSARAQSSAGTRRGARKRVPENAPTISMKDSPNSAAIIGNGNTVSLGPHRRVIPSDAVRSMIEALKPYAGKTLITSALSSDPDSVALGNTLRTVFRRAGWNVLDYPLVMSTQQGIEILIKAGPNRTVPKLAPEFAMAAVTALSLAGINARRSAREGVGDDQVEITIMPEAVTE